MIMGKINSTEKQLILWNIHSSSLHIVDKVNDFHIKNQTQLNKLQVDRIYIILELCPKMKI